MQFISEFSPEVFKSHGKFGANFYNAVPTINNGEELCFWEFFLLFCFSQNQVPNHNQKLMDWFFKKIENFCKLIEIFFSFFLFFYSFFENNLYQISLNQRRRKF